MVPPGGQPQQAPLLLARKSVACFGLERGGAMREHHVEIGIAALDELAVGGRTRAPYGVPDTFIERLHRGAPGDLRFVIAVSGTAVQKVRMRVNQTGAHESLARIERAPRRIRPRDLLCSAYRKDASVADGKRAIFDHLELLELRAPDRVGAAAAGDELGGVQHQKVNVGFHQSAPYYCSSGTPCRLSRPPDSLLHPSSPSGRWKRASPSSVFPTVSPIRPRMSAPACRM